MRSTTRLALWATSTTNSPITRRRWSSGAAALLGVLGDGVRHRPAGDAHLHRAEVLEVAAHRRLRGDDAVGREQLDELRLARHGLLLEQPRDAVLALRLARASPSGVLSLGELREQGAGGVHAVRRLLPHHATRGPSMTSAVTSSPRWAGRQCRNHAVRPGRVHERGVDLVARERGSPDVGLVLLAHRRPHVGVDGVGALHGLVRVGDELDDAAEVAGPLDDVRRRARSPAATRRSARRRVSAAANASDAATLLPSPTNTRRRPSSVPQLLPQREQVGQGLARVGAVGEQVHDRHVDRRGHAPRASAWSNTRAARIEQ